MGGLLHPLAHADVATWHHTRRETE